MELPSSAHFIYIPGMLILGMVLGFIWGAKATREAVRLEARRADERAERKARRARRTRRPPPGRPPRPPTKPEAPDPGRAARPAPGYGPREENSP